MNMLYPEAAMFELATSLGFILVVLILVGLVIGIASLPALYIILFGGSGIVRLLGDRGPQFFKFVLLMFRSLQRNLLRTSLTYLAIFVLVFMVTSILSVLNFIDNITAAKEGNQKAIITEKFQNPSGMSRDMPKQIWKIATSLPEKYQPRSYRVAKFVKENNIRRPEDLFTQLPADLKPKTLDEARDLFQMQETDDMMTWAFIAGSLEQDKITFESLIIAFCMEPRKLKTMMPGLEDLSIEELRLLEKAIAVMEEKPNSIIMGKQRLKTTRKQVGDKIQIYCKNYKGLVFDCEIIGELPEGRWDQFSAINLKFLLDKLDWFEKSNPDNPSHAYRKRAEGHWPCLAADAGHGSLSTHGRDRQ